MHLPPMLLSLTVPDMTFWAKLTPADSARGKEHEQTFFHDFKLNGYRFYAFNRLILCAIMIIEAITVEIVRTESHKVFRRL